MQQVRAVNCLYGYEMQKTAALEGKFCAEGRSRAATITRALAKRKKAAAAARVCSQLHIKYVSVHEQRE
uniref:Uncharacterized protein n=1 Tax=Trichogramma kaykai TaxID=54128 RepID=A0ABD2WWW0_9HYME